MQTDKIEQLVILTLTEFVSIYTADHQWYLSLNVKKLFPTWMRTARKLKLTIQILGCTILIRKWDQDIIFCLNINKFKGEICTGRNCGQNCRKESERMSWWRRIKADKVIFRHNNKFEHIFQLWSVTFSLFFNYSCYRKIKRRHQDELEALRILDKWK